MKKRGFGEGRWNGTGGKVREGEAIEAAAIREAQEELGLDIQGLAKVAELSFTFPHQPDFDQVVHVYLSDSWSGEPTESDEMRPQWFQADSIPYAEMWSDDVLWLPHVLEGAKLRGAFTFAPGDRVAASKVELIAGF
jgi:8-oxo-dGTP diphosphatase / 2-hydroxy-dATP diphosphatase